MTFIERLCTVLNNQGINYALVGGHAVALYGAVRGTVDVDFVLDWSLENLTKTETSLSQMELVSRLPINAQNVFENRDSYISDRNLIAWNFYNPQNLTEQVDIIINYSLEPNSIKNVEVGSTNVPLLDLEELLEMKRRSARAQDLHDIAALEELYKEELNK